MASHAVRELDLLFASRFLPRSVPCSGWSNPRHCLTYSKQVPLQRAKQMLPEQLWNNSVFNAFR